MTQPIDPTPPVKDTPPKTQAEMTWSSNISGGFGCPLVMHEAYGRAMELSDNLADVFIALGNLELQQGDARTAAERYERALAQNPNLPSAQRGSCSRIGKQVTRQRQPKPLQDLATRYFHPPRQR